MFLDKIIHLLGGHTTADVDNLYRFRDAHIDDLITSLKEEFIYYLADQKDKNKNKEVPVQPKPKPIRTARRNWHDIKSSLEASDRSLAQKEVDFKEQYWKNKERDTIKGY